MTIHPNDVVAQVEKLTAELRQCQEAHRVALLEGGVLKTELGKMRQRAKTAENDLDSLRFPYHYGSLFPTLAQRTKVREARQDEQGRLGQPITEEPPT